MTNYKYKYSKINNHIYKHFIFLLAKHFIFLLVN